MDIWKHDYEELIFLQNRSIGFKAIIAIHNTKLGPALGGCRMKRYASEADAVCDAIRLAQGMTYKSAISGIPYGGGKAVILEQPGQGTREQLFRELGRELQKLNGLYITGLDLGSTVQDMNFVKEETSYVTDVTGSLGAVNDLTATMTAYGVYLGIKASLKQTTGSESLQNRVVAVQGLGKVGYRLCRYLHADGAKLIVADIDPGRNLLAEKEFNAAICAADDLLYVPCDVLAPCALGGILDDAAVAKLDCSIIAGAANNQLAEERIGEKLHRRGIRYAPDYVINAGGIIVTAAELEGADAAKAKRDVERIYSNLQHVYAEAEKHGLSAAAAANEITRELLRK
ncbi:Leu/Phe/Val dehydrogenase [Paenibacillus sp. GCM10027627]|uniref:Leu/Phe/Val dehydrogenase n=1 Tax=unclassified Paenibacillus TaxID=185978 RepID=UPI00363396C5